jgi:hypothetical protein
MNQTSPRNTAKEKFDIIDQFTWGVERALQEWWTDPGQWQHVINDI